MMPGVTENVTEPERRAYSEEPRPSLMPKSAKSA